MMRTELDDPDGDRRHALIIRFEGGSESRPLSRAGFRDYNLSAWARTASSMASVATP